MRDERGRYTATKRIEDVVPSWAAGCDACTNGIVLAPELTGAVSLYLERLVQAIDGDVTFCTCRAGVAYRSSLLNRRQEILERARREAKGSMISTGTEIDTARVAIHAAQARNTPTVHEGERVPA
ncbi:MAG: hypothetical protein IT356_12740 [Gemmatimonadaceae bacterium]|nr:hypothetical protein [Gemmatimonadaceae bacterium]